jgi:hypothetical protein
VKQDELPGGEIAWTPDREIRMLSAQLEALRAENAKLRRVATIATYFMKATECAAQEGSWFASAYWRQLFDALKALGEGG